VGGYQAKEQAGGRWKGPERKRARFQAGEALGICRAPPTRAESG